MHGTQHEQEEGTHSLLALQPVSPYVLHFLGRA